MASIRKERLIETDPEAAWAALRDWPALNERLVPGFVTDVRLDGDDRILTFDNQFVARERLVGSSETDRRLVWSVIDGPFTHYNAAAQVLASAAGTRFVWQCDLLPDELAPLVEGMMERGISIIKHTLEATCTRLAGCSGHSPTGMPSTTIRPG
jgi:hypothetical protein